MEGRMPDSKRINITIPVYNRLDSTKKTLLSLKKNTPHWAHTVTVVDDGSEKDVGEYLLAMKKAGLIDTLFLLEENVGIAAACNVGWQFVDAPFFMKLDNDMEIRSRTWLETIFGLYSLVEPQSTFGPALSEEELREWGHPLPPTPYGRISACTGNLRGCALMVPKHVSDVLGRFNEDYDKYGAEDGDYGLRMRVSDFVQYMYDASAMLLHMDGDYGTHTLSKDTMMQRLHGVQDGGIGLFTLNGYLFALALRDIKPVPRYEVADIDGHRVRLRPTEAHAALREGLEKASRRMFEIAGTEGDEALTREDTLEEIRAIMRGCGGLAPG